MDASIPRLTTHALSFLGGDSARNPSSRFYQTLQWPLTICYPCRIGKTIEIIHDGISGICHCHLIEYQRANNAPRSEESSQNCYNPWTLDAPPSRTEAFACGSRKSSALNWRSCFVGVAYTFLHWINKTHNQTIPSFMGRIGDAEDCWSIVEQCNMVAPPEFQQVHRVLQSFCDSYIKFLYRYK